MIRTHAYHVIVIQKGLRTIVREWVGRAIARKDLPVKSVINVCPDIAGQNAKNAGVMHTERWTAENVNHIVSVR